MSQKEALARIKINSLLLESDWRFFDDENGQANIRLEKNVKISKTDIDELGKDFEKISDGFVDFLLLDENQYPLVVLEAKSEKKDPMDGKEQARTYAIALNVRFIILSNGNLHYFWDLEKGNPYIITKFPPLSSIHHVRSFTPNPQLLIDEIVDKDYIAKTQFSNYDNDPRWLDEATREEFIEGNNLKFLREYQLKAIHALQDAVSKEEDRFLFEMATGTGKTLVSAAVIKLFLRSGNAKRVLFLVDRLELEVQAQKSFVNYLKNDYRSVIYKENRDDWEKAEIVVTTVQSLLFNNKYRSLFSPTDFDLVISDEAHRSISGNARAVFEYFVGYKLGLTATPKNYLKNIDPNRINHRDPRAWERRQLLDTYKTFGCENSDPTFRYSLIEGVKDKYLINPIVLDARTEITTQLLSDKGYSVMVEDEEGNQVEKFFYQKDFEKKFFSIKTNKIFCKTFFEHSLKDPISGEIGKSIFFCVSQNHARAITQILNEFAEKLYPGKYNSDFAVQVTSVIDGAQQHTINFSNNRLNGYTRFKEGYKSSKTRVCVTVGMMTTGYDCQDILNLCLLRPIFSPSDFIQMKGRGTRKFSFTHKYRIDGHSDIIQADKLNFKLFDYFANVEYFEEKFNYDEIIDLPHIGTGEGGGGGGTISIEFENIEPDPLKTLNESVVGLEGMLIDRKFFERFEDKIKSDEFIVEQYEVGNFELAEKYIKEEIFNKPVEYFDLSKLKKAARIDRRLNIREILDFIFGKIAHLKSKDELLEEEFNQFISTNKPDYEMLLIMKNFFKAYITDKDIREIIDSKKYAQLADNPKVPISELKKLNEWKEIIPEYIKNYIPLNTFMN